MKTNFNVLVVLLLALMVGSPCCLFLFLLGYDLAGVAGAITICMWVGALVHLLVTKRPSVAIHVPLVSLLFMTFSIQILFGGGVGSAGALSVSFAAPTAAVVLGLGYSKAIGMVLLIFTVGLVTGMLEATMGPEYVTPKLYVLPKFWLAAFYWINIHCGQAINFCLVALTYHQLQTGKRRLEDRQKKVDALYAEVTRQQEQLAQEQRLAHDLIRNIFPQNVSDALINLIRDRATDNIRQRHGTSCSAARQAWRMSTEQKQTIDELQSPSHLTICPAEQNQTIDELQSPSHLTICPAPDTHQVIF